MNFKRKAAEVVERGEAERGNFQPEGAPMRMYNRWLQESNTLHARRIRQGDRKENFCHFWRVVTLWYPLMMLRLSLGIDGTGNKFTRWFKRHEDFFGASLLVLLLLLGVTILVGVVIQLIAEYGIVDFLLSILFGIVAIAVVLVVGLAAVWVLKTFFGWLGLKIQRRRAERKHQAEQVTVYDLADEAPREPGRVERFFIAAGDFLVLIGQYVRVNKWKICPFVEVNNGKSS